MTFQENTMKKAMIVSCLLLGLVFSNSACIGRMATAGKVGKFNLEVVEGKWGREIVFLALYIIPVYPIAGAIDLIIVNSIEFWTGTNPLNGQPRLARVGDTKHVVAADGSEAISTLLADGSIDIEVRAADGSAHFMNVVREDGRVVARDSTGREVAMVDSLTGQVESLMNVDRL
jgi:hypothetical protein